MSTEDIETWVRGVLADILGLDPSEVNDSTSMDTVEAWTSLNQLTLVMALEEEYGVEFSDDEIVALSSVPAVVSAVEGKLADAR